MVRDFATLSVSRSQAADIRVSMIESFQIPHHLNDSGADHQNMHERVGAAHIEFSRPPNFGKPYLSDHVCQDSVLSCMDEMRTYRIQHGPR